MDWQLVIVLAAIAGSATYLLRVGMRSWRRSQTGCAGGCACGGKGTGTKPEDKQRLILIEDIKLRRRN